MHDVVLARLGRAVVDDALGLLLGADEEDGLAAAGDVLDKGHGLVKLAHRLGQIDDVDAIALIKDIALHFGIPPLGLVTEVETCVEQIFDADTG